MKKARVFESKSTIPVEERISKSSGSEFGEEVALGSRRVWCVKLTQGLGSGIGA